MPHRFQGIVDLTYIFSELGISKAVISPGSRNVPLINAFLQNPKIECVSVVDERVAGYYALGIALKLKQPVVLICTSGTATLNYAPAIAEAYYQKVPLIILTADRPPELIDQRDNQTIRQNNIYNNYISKSFQFPTSTESDENLKYAHRISNEAVFRAKLNDQPVHINIPLCEPLYVGLPEAGAKKIIQDFTPNYQGIGIQLLTDTWRNAKRKMILVGQFNCDEDLENILSNFSNDESVLILGENLSNIHLLKCISSIERLFMHANANQPKEMLPDLLITIGGNVVSKQLKLYFRKNKPQHHWHISQEQEVVDTFETLTKKIQVEPAMFLSSLFGQSQNLNSDYQTAILSLNNRLGKVQDNYLESIELSDLKAIGQIIEALPENVSLHLGNSTPIRYAQLFKTKSKVTYFSNRGVSGIDGCVSTAAGYASQNNELSYLIVGDISFLYDSNALWINSLSKNLRIIVLNNEGGDIFRVINPGEKTGLSEFIETPQNVNIELLVKACGLEYLFADNSNDLIKNLQVLNKSSMKAIVLEVRTAGTDNAAILKELYKRFKEYKDEQY